MSVSEFCAEHNMTMTPYLARMGLTEVSRMYNAVAYRPIVSGVAYDVSHEEPNMFAGHDVPEDLVHHHVDGMDQAAYEDAPGFQVHSSLTHDRRRTIA
jgi:hypothetical protein